MRTGGDLVSKVDKIFIEQNSDRKKRGEFCVFTEKEEKVTEGEGSLKRRSP